MFVRSVVGFSRIDARIVSIVAIDVVMPGLEIMVKFFGIAFSVAAAVQQRLWCRFSVLCNEAATLGI